MPQVSERDIVLAEPNPKTHRPLFHTKAGAKKVWIAKKVTKMRKLVTNPKLPGVPSSAKYESLPKLNIWTISSWFVGLFATGGTGAGFMLLTDEVAKAAKADITHPAYGPVRDIVRLTTEGFFGLKVYPWAAHKITGDVDVGKAFWVGGTILTGVDLGITVIKYAITGINALKEKAKAPEAPAPSPVPVPAPATEEAGMALVGLSGLAALLKGTKETMPTRETPKSTELAQLGVDGMEGTAGITDTMLEQELAREKARYAELSTLVKQPADLGFAGSLVK
jgi:hypothetical protein